MSSHACGCVGICIAISDYFSYSQLFYCRCTWSVHICTTPPVFEYVWMLLQRNVRSPSGVVGCPERVWRFPGATALCLQGAAWGAGEHMWARYMSTCLHVYTIIIICFKNALDQPRDRRPLKSLKPFNLWCQIWRKTLVWKELCERPGFLVK